MLITLFRLQVIRIILFTVKAPSTYSRAAFGCSRLDKESTLLNNGPTNKS